MVEKDVRLHDHAPLSAAVSGSKPFCVLYVYEPDQLAHHSVHGSHVHFANEGLMDLERNISRSIGNTGPCITICKGEITHVLSQLEKVRKIDRIFAHEETGHNVSYARIAVYESGALENISNSSNLFKRVLLEGLKIEIILL